MAKRPKKSDASEATGSLSHNPFAALAPPSAAPAATTTPAMPTPATTTSATTTAIPASAPPPPSRPAVGVPADQAKVGRWAGKVVLAREKKGRGGKTVTRVSGLPRDRLEELKTAMKKSLGCGASIDGDDVLLHGSLTERASTWLEKAGAPRVVIGN